MAKGRRVGGEIKSEYPEGRDDEIFLKNFLETRNYAGIQVEAYGGVSNFRNFLPVLVKTPGFDRVACLGVTRDADLNPTGAFHSICHHLDYVRLDVPEEVGLFTQGNPRVGVFLFPGDGRCGMLEDLVFQTAKDEDAVQCVNDFIQCIQDNVNPFSKSIAKSKTQAYLAAMPEPVPHLGLGAEKGYWDWKSPALSDFHEFVQTLLSD